MALTQISTQGIKDGTITGSDLATNVDLVDNQKLRLGTGNDLEIFHDGTNSRIYNSTGHLILRSASYFLNNALGNETIIKAVENAAVELYHDGSKKAETTSAGFKVTGACFVSDGSASGNRLSVGNGGDLKIFHTNPNSFIQDTSSRLVIKGNIVDISDTNGDKMAEFTKDADVKLFHNGSQIFQTTSTGATVTGNLFVTNKFRGNDNVKLELGTGNDLQIFHDGGHSYIHQDGVGTLRVLADNFRLNNEADSENIIKADANGAVELYWNNAKKMETYEFGVDFAQNVKVGLHVALEDNGEVIFGNNADMKIFHDGSDNFIKVPSGGVGNIVVDLANGASGFFVRTTSSTMANQTLRNNSSGADGKDFFQCRTDNNTLRLVIEPDGDVKNQNQSYGQISDSKHKENIVDANSQWNDIKAIKVRNFNFKESTGFSTHTQIGVVAQELEITSPHLVYESTDRDPSTSEDLGTKTKNVRYSVMYMKAIKCLQEAMAKIEVLETEVAALKAG